MTARWGFDLDMSAVRLMRREGGHWQEVVREKIDGPDIEDRLMAMVSQVGEGTSVELFLPREQILYTDVKVTSEDAAPEEIKSALDGRTPYKLDELDFDWAMTESDTARVAAIALETLDEAAAFAEARGLKVAGYSSLADSEDFPRLPAFTSGVDFAVDEPIAETEESAPEVAFASVRDTGTTGRLTSAEAAPEGPVVEVAETTPVMQVKAKALPPLNPGAPLPHSVSEPRVRTDIAASTQSGAVATLTPPSPSIRLRTPVSAPRRTLIVFAVAALLTIGIAAIVWSILPLAPGRTNIAPPEATQGGALEEPSEQEFAAAPTTREEAAPTVTTDLVGLGEPETTMSEPVMPRPDPSTVQRSAPEMVVATALPDAAPREENVAALEPTPETIAVTQVVAPNQGLDGTEDIAESTDEIYLASIEPRDLAFDAIALPPAGALAAEALPQIGQPPAETSSDGVETAALDPAVVAGREAPAAIDEPGIETSASEGGSLPASALRPTALAASLPDRAPRARPSSFDEEIERRKFGRRTRSELAEIAPRARPDSAQLLALSTREEAEASDLAVATSAVPRARPADFDATVASALVQARAAEATASVNYQTPDTSAAIEAALAADAEPEPRPQDTPRLAIPSDASVSRQATIEDAIRLNRINLVGVYGVPSDRRALIRLPSGRYVKVKVGDRVDGGTVAQINDTELLYRKGSRTISLALPKG